MAIKRRIKAGGSFYYISLETGEPVLIYNLDKERDIELLFISPDQHDRMEYTSKAVKAKRTPKTKK